MSRLKTLWRLLNLRCEGMCRLASESLDRDLGLVGWVALRLHLRYCAPAAASGGRSSTCGAPCGGCQDTWRTESHCPVLVSRMKCVSGSKCALRGN